MNFDKNGICKVNIKPGQVKPGDVIYVYVEDNGKRSNAKIVTLPTGSESILPPTRISTNLSTQVLLIGAGLLVVLLSKRKEEKMIH